MSPPAFVNIPPDIEKYKEILLGNIRLDMGAFCPGMGLVSKMEAVPTPQSA
jgi:hypothetical protein